MSHPFLHPILISGPVRHGTAQLAFRDSDNFAAVHVHGPLSLFHPKQTNRGQSIHGLIIQTQPAWDRWTGGNAKDVLTRVPATQRHARGASRFAQPVSSVHFRGDYVE